MRSEWRDATSSGDLNKVCTLLDQGADINSLDEHGQTALMNAVYRGDVELAQILIQRGADLNHAAKYQLTALMLAVINNRTEIVRLLVKAGADTTIRGSRAGFDLTPLQYAQEHGKLAVAEILSKGT